MAENDSITRDPVCGMTLREDKAPEKFEYEGRTYYFCARGCRERFEKNPERYLSGVDVDWVAE